jgi:hypothetical protein
LLMETDRGSFILPPKPVRPIPGLLLHHSFVQNGLHRPCEGLSLAVGSLPTTAPGRYCRANDARTSATCTARTVHFPGMFLIIFDCSLGLLRPLVEGDRGFGNSFFFYWVRSNGLTAKSGGQRLGINKSGDDI